jgi:outer membrane protein
MEQPINSALIQNKVKHFSFVRAFLIGIYAVSLIAAGAVYANAENEKMEIVSIDTARILEIHPAFVDAQQTFQNEMQEMENQLMEMGEEEQMMAQQMMQQRLQARGQELQQQAMSEVKADIEKVAKEKGYRYVVDSNALLVGGKDITEEVIEAMDIEQQQHR